VRGCEFQGQGAEGWWAEVGVWEVWDVGLLSFG